MAKKRPKGVSGDGLALRLDLLRKTFGAREIDVKVRVYPGPRFRVLSVESDASHSVAPSSDVDFDESGLGFGERLSLRYGIAAEDRRRLSKEREGGGYHG